MRAVATPQLGQFIRDCKARINDIAGGQRSYCRLYDTSAAVPERAMGCMPCPGFCRRTRRPNATWASVGTHYCGFWVYLFRSILECLRCLNLLRTPSGREARSNHGLLEFHSPHFPFMFMNCSFECGDAHGRASLEMVKRTEVRSKRPLRPCPTADRCLFSRSCRSAWT